MGRWQEGEAASRVTLGALNAGPCGTEHRSRGVHPPGPIGHQLRTRGQGSQEEGCQFPGLGSEGQQKPSGKEVSVLAGEFRAGGPDVARMRGRGQKVGGVCFRPHRPGGRLVPRRRSVSAGGHGVRPRPVSAGTGGRAGRQSTGREALSGHRQRPCWA